MEFQIGNKKVGDDHPVFFIAEAGVNHNGSIDIAKKYSTPKSKRFINGVLDVLSKKIKDKIHKTGKGLIDNK